MKELLCLVLLTALGLPMAGAADSERVTYYVQLVRGNNDHKPPEADNRPVGPKLSKELRRIFAWKSYWEVNQRQVEIAPQQKARLKLSHERAVEIDLSVPGKRKITAFSDGKPMTEITRPVGQKITIIGGDRDTNSAWFIVVRHDKPSEE